MKNIKYILYTLTIVLSVASCTSKPSTQKYDVNPYSTSELISKTIQGLVTLRGVSDEASSEMEAINSAERKALEKLLYQGFPGTDFAQPMISGYTKTTIESQKNEYFKSLWNGGYKEFIVENKSKTYKCSGKNNCFTASTVFTINYNNLRKDLERNSVIKKLGF